MLSWILAIVFFIAALGFLIKHIVEAIFNKIILKQIRAMESKRYSHASKFAKHKSIVFLGDSITHRFLISDYFSPYPVFNRGIEGDTTVGILERLESNVLCLEPELVILLIGTNDLQILKSTPSEISSRIELIVTRILERSSSTKIMIQSVYPVHKSKAKRIRPSVVGHRKNEDIIELNTHIQGICSDHGLDYIDVFTHLLDESGELKLEYTLEGLHIRPEGYDAIREVILPFLKSYSK